MKPAKVIQICFVLALFLAFSHNANSATIYENFGGTINYANAVKNPDAAKEESMVLIGTYESYTFASGVSFISPVPNIYGDWKPEISILNNKEYFDFWSYGYLMPNSGVIPGGTDARLLMQYGASSEHFSPYYLSFPGVGATSFSLCAIMGGCTPGTDKIVITAFDARNNLLSTIYADACNISNFANNVYEFTSSGTLIKYIGIDYSTNDYADHPGIANLVFDINACDGDADNSGTVDGADLNTLLSNYGKAGNWFSGDFDGNGFVDGADLNILLSNYGQGSEINPNVPEPSAIWLIIGTLAGLILYFGLFPRKFVSS